MADKTWVATDLGMGQITIIRRESELQLVRRYQFLDSDGAVMEQIAGGRLRIEIDISSVPPDVLAALQAIDTWTKNQALIQEGMD